MERGKSLNLRHSKNHPADKSHNFTNWILSSSSLFAQINFFFRHPSDIPALLLTDTGKWDRIYWRIHNSSQSKKENHSHVSSDPTSLSCQAVLGVNKTPPDGVYLSTHVLLLFIMLTLLCFARLFYYLRTLLGAEVRWAQRYLHKSREKALQVFSGRICAFSLFPLTSSLLSSFDDVLITLLHCTLVWCGLL